MKTKTHKEYDLELFQMEATLWPVEKYVTAKTKILHECINGHLIHIAPDTILSQNVGCSECKNLNRRKTTDEYLEELRTKNITYSPLELYQTTNSPIDHKCPTCLHIWKIKPAHILRGHGCPVCHRLGPALDLPAILYYIKIGEYYKIGVTGNSVFTRFSKDRDKSLYILMEITYSTGEEAIKEEIKLLEQYKDYRITKPGYLKSKGNSELFSKDILNLDDKSKINIHK